MQVRGFLGGSYVSQSPIADQEQTINWYTERIESTGAPSQLALYPTPGVTEVGSTVGGTGRAHYSQANREFAVIGNTFYEINQAGTKTSRGTVATDANPATICSNGDGGGQLFVTSGNNGYIFDMGTNVFTQVRTGATTMGDQLDGYFIALDTATSTFYISDLFDGLTWDPTQFAQRSTAPDPWIAMKVANRYIWLLGTETSEVWYNAGTSPFPFAQHPSGLLSYGCAASFSPEVADGALYWLGATANGHGMVLRASGFTPEDISTYALQVELNAYDILSDAIGDTYSDLGHTFYVLTFPDADRTWVWDIKMSQWHQRGTWIVADNDYQAWRPLYHTFVFGEHRMLDIGEGAVYTMGSDIGTDVDGLAIRRVRRSPAMVRENQRVFYKGFELYLEPGLGLSTGQGSNPQVMLRISNNGGKTWVSEQFRSAGAIGEYSKRVRWDRCGSGRKRVHEISVTDPIPWRIMDAFTEIEDSADLKRSA